MIFGIKNIHNLTHTMYCWLLLTNIPMRLMTGFVVQGHIYHLFSWRPNQYETKLLDTARSWLPAKKKLSSVCSLTCIFARAKDSIQKEAAGCWGEGKGNSNSAVWGASAEHKGQLVYGGDLSGRQCQVPHGCGRDPAPPHYSQCHHQWWCCVHLWDEGRQPHCGWTYSAG